MRWKRKANAVFHRVRMEPTETNGPVGSPHPSPAPPYTKTHTVQSDQHMQKHRVDWHFDDSVGDSILCVKSRQVYVDPSRLTQQATVDAVAVVREEPAVWKKHPPRPAIQISKQLNISRMSERIDGTDKEWVFLPSRLRATSMYLASPNAKTGSIAPTQRRRRHDT